MMARNQSPNLISGGNVSPSVFVKLSTSADNTGLQADANATIVGISGVNTKDPPGITGSTSYHAESGDMLELFGQGDICLLKAGSSGFTRGERLKSDANGYGTAIANSGSSQNVGAIALESAASGEFGRVMVVIYAVDPTSDDTIAFPDDESLSFGDGSDTQMLWSTGDSSNHAFVVAVGASQALHLTDVAAKATDWNISATTHPNIYIHSDTTPATDYIRIGGHDASTADIDVVSGTLNLMIDGTAECTMTASGFRVADGNTLLVGDATARTVSDGDGATNHTPTFQVLGTAKADSSMLLGGWNTTDNATVAPQLGFLKSGNGTIGSNTIVASGEVLGEIVWFGDDGADYEAPAGAIRCEVDTTPGAGDMPGRLVFLTTADSGETLTEAARISSAQNLCVGNGNGLIVGALTQQVVSDGDGSTNLTPEVQIQGTAKADSSLLLGAWNTTDDKTVAPQLGFLKSGNGTIGSKTAVSADEVLGEIVWFGDDGTDYESPGGAIRCEVDASVGTGDMPGRIVFLTTADGGETLTEACRITSAQNFCVGNGNALVVGANAPQASVGAAAYECQVLGTALADSSALLACWNTTDSVRAELAFLKSGNGTIGSSTVVANGENLGGIVWYADDGVDFTSAAASIEALIAAAPGSNDTAGALQINCTADGAATVAEVGRFSNANGLTLGVAGTKLGKLQMCGNTSGTITINGAAAAGTYTLTLPPDDGDAGEQLQTDGSGVTTWEAAGSMRAFKNVLGSLSDKAHEALDRVLSRDVYAFQYKGRDEVDYRITTTGDTKTEYHGVMADEYPEVMHHNGRIFSPVSAFGELMLAIKALAQKIDRLENASVA